MENIATIFDKIWDSAKSVWGWLLALTATFADLAGVYYLMLMIAFADLVTGLWASHRRKIPRTSHRLRKSVEKLLCYGGVIYLFYEFEVRLGLDWEFLCSYKVIAGFIYLVELISILENMAIITANPIFLKIVRLIRGKAKEKGGSLAADLATEKNEEHEPHNKNIKEEDINDNQAQ